MKPERGLKRVLQILFGISTASLGIFVFLFLYFFSNPSDENAVHAGNESSFFETDTLDGYSDDSNFSVPANDDVSGRNDNGSKNADSSEELGESSGNHEPASMEESEIKETKAPLVNLIMVGDMLMHLRVTQSGKMEDGSYNYDAIFANVKEDVEAADLAIVNQEVILGGEELGFSGYPTFNTSYALGDAIVNAGFDVVLHATNHTMDKGKQGILNCSNYWKSNHPEIAVLGMYETEEESEEIYVYEQDGIRIAILNYTYGLNGLPKPSDMPFAVNLMEEDKMRSDIEKAKTLADFIVVCPHWGTEYKTTESDNQRMWCNFFSDLGVDLVIGTHPHVIEPVEVYERKDGHQMLVYYSLGNFINSTADSGRGIGKRVVGAMAKVTISRDEAGEVFVKEYGVTPLITQIEAGPGAITTYRLSDYTQELYERNQMTRKDPDFSIEMCKDLCREVFGDLFVE